MAVSITGSYIGGLKVELEHGPSGTVLRTSAPSDKGGDSGSFSSTDLVAGALGSCMLTVMAIAAEREGIDFVGVSFALEKHMQSNPRRIGSVPVRFRMPKGLTGAQRKKLERAAHLCPVLRSLLPDVDTKVTFVYPDEQ